MWHRVRPAWGALGVAAVFLTMAAAWIGVRAVMPTDGAPVLTDDGFSKGLIVDPSDSDPTPLRSGDAVIAINGRSIDRVLMHGAPVRLRSGAVVRYQVRRDGHAFEQRIRLRRGGLVGDRLRASAGILLVALALVGFGGWAVLRRPEHPAARALILLAAGFLAYNVFEALSTDSVSLAGARPIFALGVAGTVGSLGVWATAAALLALSFPNPIGALTRQPRMTAAPYGVVLLLSAGLEGGSIIFGHASRRELDALYSLFEAVLYLLVVVTLAGFGRTIARSVRDPVVRRQGGVVALGMAITVTLVAVANAFSGSRPLPAWFAPLAFLPMPAALAVAIVRGEFLDLRATINRALVFASVTALLLAIYAVVVAAFGVVVGGTGLAATIPATGIVAIALAPARANIQRAVDRVIYGQRGDPARILTQLGRRLNAAMPADQVLPAVADTLAQALRLPYIGIRVGSNSTAPLAWERGQPSGDIETYPLMRSDRAVGALLVAPRRGQRTLTADDRTILRDVASQLATAIDAASLYTELTASRAQLAVAREEERARLRHDLHDRLGSRLTGLSLQLDTLGSRADDDAVSAAAKTAHAELQQALDDVRRLARGLRPAELEDLGLVPAIESAARRLTVGDDEGGWSVIVDAAVQLPPIAPEVAAAAYHIVNEALTNAYRHSGGSGAHVRVGTSADGRALTVEVTDDGAGINQSTQSGVGLASMRQRASDVHGHLELGTSPAGGAIVRAVLPLAR